MNNLEELKEKSNKFKKEFIELLQKHNCYLYNDRDTGWEIELENKYCISLYEISKEM
jgi:hypothetical protein